MEFNDVLIAEIQADPVNRTLKLVKEALAELDNDSPPEAGWSDEEYDVLVQAGAFLVELLDAGMLSLDVHYPDVGGDRTKDCSGLAKFLRSVEKECETLSSRVRFVDARSKFKAALDSSFRIEFSDGDLARLQTLLNELREQIGLTDGLEEKHRQRLFSRLERLQSELHKRVSDVDRFLGFVCDVGVVFEKLGKNAKPLVDRAREIASIVWHTQARAEELPSSAKPPAIGYGSGERSDG